MIHTRIVEIIAHDGTTQEVDLGCCTFPELPVEKKPPVHTKPDEMPPPPLVVRVNDQPMFVIGHTWEITTGKEAVFVLIVQKIPEASSIIKAGSDAIEKLRHLLPEPKKN